MLFKSPRQRRRHHTTCKTLKRYKRQLNAEDRKSWYATHHQHYRDQEHYHLAHFDERAWYSAMRASSTLGLLRGNHHAKYDDPWGERHEQTLCRARRERTAIAYALAGYEDTGLEMREGARPGLRRNRRINRTNATHRLAVINERVSQLHAYQDARTGLRTLKLHFAQHEIHTLERERERLTLALAA